MNFVRTSDGSSCTETGNENDNRSAGRNYRNACVLRAGRGEEPEPMRRGIPLSEWIKRTEDPSPSTRQSAALVIRTLRPAKAAVPRLLNCWRTRTPASANRPRGPWARSPRMPNRRRRR